MTSLLTPLFPFLPDLLLWARKRHRWAVGLLLAGAAGSAAVRLLLVPVETVAQIRFYRDAAYRQNWLRQQTDSLYPLW